MYGEDRREVDLEKGLGKNIKEVNGEKIILDILREYENSNCSETNLTKWVVLCLDYLFLSHTDKCRVRERKYNGCTIEFRSCPGLFNILKPQLIREEGSGETYIPTGVVYDVTLFVSTYTELNFGIKNLNWLRKSIHLDQSDIQSLAEDISSEINQWSSNIETVFTGALFKPKS